MSMLLSRVSYRGLSRLAPRITHAAFSTTRLHLLERRESLGVNAVLHDSAGNPIPRSKIFEEFSLLHRVGIVSGGNGGLGLEMALALCELGARAVYCLDLPHMPSDEWQAAKDYVRRMGTGGRLEYVCADVRDQKGLKMRLKNIGDLEERMDFCVAAAGIAREQEDCLEYSAKTFEEVLDVNVNGVLYTAQATGQQMLRFGNAGSIILIASMSGSVTNKDDPIIPYNTSKSAVIQMARSMACELGAKQIRVNSVSPGHILTPLTSGRLEGNPGLLEKWASLYPMGRIGRPDELRGVVAWLASDASSFCTGSNIVVDGGYTAW